MESLSQTTGQISNIAYCMVAVIIGGVKTYIHKFLPVLGKTKIPDFTRESTENDLQIDSHLLRETLEEFWRSNSLYQANGNWKGGEWGKNNLPTTDETFCYDSFIGDEVKIEIIKSGIIPYTVRKSTPFDNDDEIIIGSELCALSVNVTLVKTGKVYSGYMCDIPIPQEAIDVLFVCDTNEDTLVKLLRRGSSHPNVDMPELLQPGAGEHREPGNKVSIKHDALRAVREEIGISQETLMNCYLLPQGSEEEEGRDSRYWLYSAYQNGEIINFGLHRKSKTDVFLLYVKCNTTSDIKEIKPLDEIEINQKFWISLNDDKLKNREIFMIPEHAKYIEYAIDSLKSFRKTPLEIQESFRFDIAC